MNIANFIPAIGTPLTDDDENLHVEGLTSELAYIHNAGITDIFAAGSMGAMPLLRDDTYRKLVAQCAETWKGRGRLLVGAGDTSFARTRDRIEFLNRFDLNAVVVLAPYFWNFDQAQLIDYFSSLARSSRAPLYLYDLPQVTHTRIELETVLALSRQHNIAGIKCSGEPSYTRELVDRVGDSFEVIIAQPTLVDVFLRHGLVHHLDGMFALAPEWTMQIGDAVARQDWSGAAKAQQALTALRNCIVRYDLPSFTVLMNARGIPGNFAPSPYAKLDPESEQVVLNLPVVRKFLGR